MAETRFIYDNLWRKGTMLTPSSEDPKHLATDTQIDTLNMYWKASSTEQTATIPINQGATPGAIDFVAILEHNIEAAGVVITLQGADDAAFTVNVVSRVLTHNVTNIFEFVTTFTKQYVRIKLVRAAGVFPVLPQIATIFCGAYFEPNIDYVKGYAPGIEDPSDIDFTDDMVMYARERPVMKIWHLPYWSLDDTSQAKVILMMEECGNKKALVVVFDKNNSNTDSHLVRIESASSPVFQFINLWDWDVSLIEVK